jgi:hypothetical protein
VSLQQIIKKVASQAKKHEYALTAAKVGVKLPHNFELELQADERKELGLFLLNSPEFKSETPFNQRTILSSVSPAFAGMDFTDQNNILAYINKRPTSQLFPPKTPSIKSAIREGFLQGITPERAGKGMLTLFNIMTNVFSAPGSFVGGVYRGREMGEKDISIFHTPGEQRELRSKMMAEPFKSVWRSLMGEPGLLAESMGVKGLKGFLIDVVSDPVMWWIGYGGIKALVGAVTARTVATKTKHMDDVLKIIAKKNPEVAAHMRANLKIAGRGLVQKELEIEAAPIIQRLAKGDTTALKDVHKFLKKYDYDDVVHIFTNQTIVESRKLGTLSGLSKVEPALKQILKPKVINSQKWAMKSSRLHVREGGSSLNAKLYNPIGKPGYMVEYYPDRTKIFKGKKISQRDINKFIKKNSDLLINEDNYVGTWYNSQEGVSYLGVSKKYLDKTEALYWGQIKKQKSIFDLLTMQDITVPAKPVVYNPTMGGLRFGGEPPAYIKKLNIGEILEKEGPHKLLLDAVKRYTEITKVAPRAKITHKETTRLANLTGTTVEQFLKRKPGTMMSNVHVKVGADLLAQQQQRVWAIVKAIEKNPTDENFIALLIERNKFAEMANAYVKLGEDIGRALENDTSKRVSASTKLLDKHGGRESAMELFSKLAMIDPNDEIAVAQFLRTTVKATTRDKIFEAWISSLLSSPATHMVNSTSNAVIALLSPFERAAGAGIEVIRAGVTGTPREVFFGEVGQQWIGMGLGIKQGVPKAMKAFITEIPSEGLSKVEFLRKWGAIGGKTGRTVRVPLRFLMAEDEFFKAWNYSMEMRALAFRKAAIVAKKKKWSRKQLYGEMYRLLANPTDDMIEGATGEMMYRVFQQESQFAKGLTNLRARAPGLEYILPFIRTPLNIAKFGLERTPLNFLKIMKDVKQGTLAGGQLSLELGKTMMGSAISSFVMFEVLEGKITGMGPTNPSERGAWLRADNQPYSWNPTGDMWYSFSRLEPIGMVVGLTADFAQLLPGMSEGEVQDFATYIVLSIAKNVTNKTFMQGFSNVMDAISDPERYGKRLSDKQIGSLVPRIISSYTRAGDPALKRPSGFLEIFKAQLPYFSKDVLSRLDLWGEEIIYGESKVERFASPVRRKKITRDKVNEELLRLGRKFKSFISMPSRYIKGIKINDADYNWFVRSAGSPAKKRLDAMVNSKGWDAMADFKKYKIMKAQITAFREVARAALWKEILKGRYGGIRMTPMGPELVDPSEWEKKAPGEKYETIWDRIQNMMVEEESPIAPYKPGQPVPLYKETP